VYQIKSTGHYTFELVLDNEKDIAAFANCDHPATQGYIMQVKKPVTMSFQTYEEALDSPNEMMMTDFAKFDRPGLLHLAYKALHVFMEEKHHLPNPGSIDDANALYEIVKSLDKDNILENTSKADRIIKHFASGSQAILSPMCAAIGGIVGQEVLKACSGKFTPIRGFLYFDADETLPDDILEPEEVTPTGTSRYDSQIAVFGKSIQNTILNQRFFLVGAY
jgi:ubiquitin-activating enzyme E1